MIITDNIRINTIIIITLIKSNRLFRREALKYNLIVPITNKTCHQGAKMEVILVNSMGHRQRRALLLIALMRKRWGCWRNANGSSKSLRRRDNCNSIKLACVNLQDAAQLIANKAPASTIPSQPPRIKLTIQLSVGAERRPKNRRKLIISMAIGPQLISNRSSDSRLKKTSILRATTGMMTTMTRRAMEK